MLDETAQAIDTFLSGALRSQWIETPEVKLYLRKSRRFAHGRMWRVIDIADIKAKEERRGTFTGVLTYLQRKTGNGLYGYEGVFIESVLTPHLAGHLQKLKALDPRWIQRPGEDINFLWLQVSR